MNQQHDALWWSEQNLMIEHRTDISLLTNYFININKISLEIAVLLKIIECSYFITYARYMKVYFPALCTHIQRTFFTHSLSPMSVVNRNVYEQKS